MQRLLQGIIRFWGRSNFGRYGDPHVGNFSFVFSMIANAGMVVTTILALVPPFNHAVAIGAMVYWSSYFTGNLLIRALGILAWRKQLSSSAADDAVDWIELLSWSWPMALLMGTVAAPFYFTGKTVQFFSIGSRRYMLEQVQAPPQISAKSRND